MEINNYIPYKKIVDYLDIKQGDNICLSSDIMLLFWMSKRNGETFCEKDFIDSILDRIGSEGTLLLPVFSYSFSNHGYYDILKTKGSTGVLGNYAMTDERFKRTQHPIHSFMVYGKDQEILCGLKNRNSFGDDSPFKYMYENNVAEILLNVDYNRALSFAHWCEIKAEVPYRFLKEFTGTYVDSKGKAEVRTYEYWARDLTVKTKALTNKMGEYLESKGISTCYNINKNLIKKVSLRDSYQFIYNDAKYNMCRRLYEFEGMMRENIFSKDFKITKD